MEMNPDLGELRIGYAGYSSDFSHPADRRRFAGYAAARGLRVENAPSSDGFDMVVVSERADLTYWHRQRANGVRLVFDFIDSYLAVPRHRVGNLARGAAKFAARQHRHLELSYWATLRRMCRASDAVVCTTRAQERMIGSLNRNVHRVLDDHASEFGEQPQRSAAPGPPRLLWEGQAQNILTLRTIRRALATVHQRTAATLTLVTDPAYAPWLGRVGRRDTLDRARRICPGIPTSLSPWQADALKAAAWQSHLGIIPIPNDPLYQGKPENKLLILWRLGLPTITSSTSAYDEAMRDAGLRLTCRSESEWIDTMCWLLDDKAARDAAATAGRAYVERTHRPDILHRAWDAVLASAMNGGAPNK